jgi:trehalose 6-phosphate synthase
MFRNVVAAFTMLVAAILAISPFASTLVEQWSRRDVELRSALVFNSVRDELANLLAAGATSRIESLFAGQAAHPRRGWRFESDSPGASTRSLRMWPLMTWPAG